MAPTHRTRGRFEHHLAGMEKGRVGEGWVANYPIHPDPGSGMMPQIAHPSRHGVISSARPEGNVTAIEPSPQLPAPTIVSSCLIGPEGF